MGYDGTQPLTYVQVTLETRLGLLSFSHIIISTVAHVVGSDLSIATVAGKLCM